jgi:hypothetical protein
MNIQKRFAASLFVLMAFAVTAAAQTQPADETRLTFSNPAQPGRLVVSLINGSIAVAGHDNKEIAVRAAARAGAQPGQQPGGRWVIPNYSTGLKVVEAANVVTVSIPPVMDAVDLVILVPRQTSLKLNTINMGEISVEGVSGELELGNVNGGITARDVSGSLVAQTTNGRILADVRVLDARKPLALSTLNGDIEVTLPAATQASVSLKTRYGSIVSAFDLALQEAPPGVEQTKDAAGTRYRIHTESTLRGAIGRGGIAIDLRTFNGHITLHKGR